MTHFFKYDPIVNFRRPEQDSEQSQLPPAVALTDNLPIAVEDQEEPYDSYGNYIGDQGKSHGRES